MKSAIQTLLYIIFVALLHQVQRIYFLVSPRSRWWKCCLMKPTSFLLWMNVLHCCCLASPSFWNSVHALRSVQEADFRFQVESWQQDRSTADYNWIYYVRILPPSVKSSKASYLLIIWEGKIFYLCCSELSKALERITSVKAKYFSSSIEDFRLNIHARFRGKLKKNSGSVYVCIYMYIYEICCVCSAAWNSVSPIFF